MSQESGVVNQLLESGVHDRTVLLPAACLNCGATIGDMEHVMAGTDLDHECPLRPLDERRVKEVQHQDGPTIEDFITAGTAICAAPGIHKGCRCINCRGRLFETEPDAHTRETAKRLRVVK